MSSFGPGRRRRSLPKINRILERPAHSESRTAASGIFPAENFQPTLARTAVGKVTIVDLGLRDRATCSRSSLLIDGLVYYRGNPTRKV